MQHNKPLPSCEGPKMYPYEDPNPDIEFEERLDAEEGGYVFKVKINSQPFALKVFKFFDVLGERKDFTPAIDVEIPDEVFEAHIDPFYAECRAYGRINEFYKDTIPETFGKVIREFSPGKPQRGEKKTVAAQCYGYLHLSPKDEEHLSKSYHDLQWERETKDEGKPLRALVKQLIDPIDEKNQPNTFQACDNLQTLHGIGIFPNNISSHNYRNNLLMSFSRSYTVPHCAIEALPELRAAADFDMQLVGHMISAQGIQPPMTAVY